MWKNILKNRVILIQEMYFCSRCHFRHLQGRFCPFGFVLKPVGPETLILSEFRACVRVKTSISWKHACWTLHSRFCPFGFVLKPVGPEHPYLDKFGVFSRKWKIAFVIFMERLCNSDFKMYFCSRCHFRHLHSRFCPFGFVLKPVALETLILDELGALFDSKNMHFVKPCLLNSP